MACMHVRPSVSECVNKTEETSVAKRENREKENKTFIYTHIQNEPTDKRTTTTKKHQRDHEPTYIHMLERVHTQFFSVDFYNLTQFSNQNHNNNV